MKLNLISIISGFNLSQINTNFQSIVTELQNKVMYRNNPIGEPNTLETDIDANGKNIYNVQTLSVLGTFIVAGIDISAQVAAAAASAVQSAASAVASAASAALALVRANSSLAYSNLSAQSYALTSSIASSFAGGSIGFTSSAYDFGSVADATTYFNRDFGSIV